MTPGTRDDFIYLSTKNLAIQQAGQQLGTKYLGAIPINEGHTFDI